MTHSSHSPSRLQNTLSTVPSSSWTQTALVWHVQTSHPFPLAMVPYPRMLQGLHLQSRLPMSTTSQSQTARQIPRVVAQVLLAVARPDHQAPRHPPRPVPLPFSQLFPLLLSRCWLWSAFSQSVKSVTTIRWRFSTRSSLTKLNAQEIISQPYI